MITKAVFRPGELILSNETVFLEPPQAYAAASPLLGSELEEMNEIDAMPEFIGPTAEELRQEAELFKAKWDVEREEMIQEAKDKAAAIVSAAQVNASEELLRTTNDAQTLKQQAEADAEKILADAKRKAQEIERSAQSAFEKERKDAVEAGFKEGREAGFSDGKAEVDRLTERVRTVLERAQSRREEILEETEQQIIDLVLLLARKVIKIISESQRDVVKANVTQALRKLKGRGNIIIRVNMVDLKLTSEHINNFLQKMEGIKIQIAEDSTVDPGGCIIETDFGEIDARISSQFAELESKILEMTPIRTKPKPSPETVSASPSGAAG
jgi:flagellar assembly protein FliH